MSVFPFYVWFPVVALCACQGPSGDHQLQALRVERAAADALAALEAGDVRLLGVLGVTCEVPGSVYMCSEAEQRYGLRVLKGTSDEPHEGREEELDARARRYARVYNETIISRTPSSN